MKYYCITVRKNNNCLELFIIFFGHYLLLGKEKRMNNDTNINASSNGSYVVDTIKVAGAYLAFFIGSGYATGQEILQFFTSFGWQGMITAGISLILCIWMGVTIIRDGRLLNTSSGGIMWEYYCGRILGKAFDYFALFIQFGVFVVMIGGAGAAVQTYLGLPSMVGRIGMAIVCMLSVLLGLQNLIDVLGAIGPVIIVFTIVVGIYSVIHNWGSIGEVSSNVQGLTILKSCNNPALSGVLYVGFNAMYVMPFLFSMGPTVKAMKTGKIGGALGGVLLVCAIVIMMTAQLLSIKLLYNAQIPTLVLTGAISPAVSGIFTVIILLGIYSTAAGLLWLVCDRVGRRSRKVFVSTNVIIVIATIILSVLPFSKLVNIVYGWSGWIGLIAIAIFIARQTFLFKKERIEEYQRIDAERNEAYEAKKAAKDVSRSPMVSNSNE